MTEVRTFHLRSFSFVAIAVVLAGLQLPARSSAQDFVLTGTSLPKDGVLLQSFSFGFQVDESTITETTSGRVFEHPLVLAKRYAPSSAAVLKAFASGAVLSTATVARQQDATTLAPPGLTLTDTSLTSYTLDAKLSADGRVFTVSEQLALRYATAKLAAKATVLPGPTASTPVISAFMLEAPELSTFSTTTRSNVTSLSLSFARADAVASSGAYRAEPLIIGRRASATSESPFFAELLRTGRVLKELVLVGLDTALKGRIVEIRLRDVRVTQYRLVAGSGAVATELIGLSFGSFELVPFTAGAAGTPAVVTFGQ